MSDEPTTTAEPAPARLRAPAALLLWSAVPLAVAVVFAAGGWVSWRFAIAVAAGFPVVAGLGSFLTGTTAVIPLTAVAATLLVLAGPLLPSPRPREPRSGYHRFCVNRLKQIGLALHGYHDVYGCFPPAVTADKAGRPMHGWRVLMLPYFEQAGLYAQYRLDEPWNGPNNRKLGDVILDDLICPNYAGDPEGVTTYVAVIGPNTAWRVNESVSLDDITDGTSSTILVVEVADFSFPWIEPRDLHVLQMAPGINPEGGRGISSPHPAGANVLFADGTVRTLPNDTPPEPIEAMLTIAGGEEVELDD